MEEKKTTETPALHGMRPEWLLSLLLSWPLTLGLRIYKCAQAIQHFESVAQISALTPPMGKSVETDVCGTQVSLSPSESGLSAHVSNKLHI